MVGQNISHYRVLQKLGEGGMGVVYKAEDLKLERPVALKFLAAHALEDPEHKTRFVREAKAAARLDHQNICPVYEIDEADGQTFLAMAYLEGQTLKDKIAERPLKLEEALDIAIQTVEGLKAAHQKEIVHRDIKPANLMVTAEGQVKIMDFGLAQLADRSKLTKTATILGTPAYMSPEQAQREPTDRRTDIWSLGVVIYEMITGRLPFEGERQEAILYAIGNEEPEPITAMRARVPMDLERIVGKALAKDRGARYQHMDDLLVDLRQLKKTRDLAAAKGPPAPAASAPGRKLWYAGAAGAALLLVLLGVVGSRLTGPSAPEPEAMLSAVPLTSFEGQEQDATFSPDGNQVAFAWNGPNQDNFDIYVQVVGSPSPPLRLTSDPATDVAPAWSPDGRRIAFVRAVGERNTVRLISPLGGPDRELAEFVFGYFYVSRFPTLAWLPDADSLLVAGNESTNEPAAIYSLSAATGEKVRLTSPTAGSLGDQRSAVSPDGNTVAFVRYASPAAPAQIHLMPSQGGEPKLLARHNSIQGVTWLPHGREIVFSSGSYAQSQTRRLWRIAVGGGDPRLLAGIGENASKPVVAPNGNRLVFERSVFDPNIWRYELEGSSNQPRKLIASTRAERSVQLSPDGKRIAFFSQRSGSSEIWLAGSDGSNPIQLTSFSGPSAGSPRWSPDGQSIAFDSNLQGSWDVYVVNAQGGAPRAVAVGEGEESRPSWSRDGQWIYFNSDRGGTHQIYRIPVQGGEPVRVSQAGGYNPFESPDGRFVYYGRGPMEAGLWRIPAEGGDEEAVLPGLGGVAVGRGHWDVVEGGVYFLDDAEAPEAGSGVVLKFLDLDTRQARRVADLQRPPASASTPFDVAPDGSWFAYAQLDQSDSDLMLVEDFR